MTTISANPSKQRQWTQEVRYAGDAVAVAELRRRRLRLPPDASTRPASSRNRARRRRAFLLAPTALAATPGLLDGYGQTSDIRSTNASAAAVRPARVGGHRSPARCCRACGSTTTTRTWTSTAGLRRPADHRPGADRAAAVGPRAAGLSGRRRRHQPLGPADGGVPGGSSA